MMFNTWAAKWSFVCSWSSFSNCTHIDFSKKLMMVFFTGQLSRYQR